MSVKLELEKSELDLIADSLAFRQKELQRRINKTKNLNNKQHKKNVKEENEIDKLLEDLYKIDNNISHGILYGVRK